MPIYLYDCPDKHVTEKRYAVTTSRRDIPCQHVNDDLTPCRKPAKRREVYAANINMGKDGTRNRV